MEKLRIPIALAGKDSAPGHMHIIAADSGGTKTHMALFEVDKGNFRIVRERIYKSKEWTTFTDMVMDFAAAPPQPDRLCFAVAGPVQDGRVHMTNLDWVIDVKELQTTTGVEHISLINDLQGIGYGLAALSSDDIETIYRPAVTMSGNAAIIAPGTGLGEAGLFWDGQALHPFDTEGGHTDFAARNSFDQEMYVYLQGKFGHVSWERLVSGMGIATIFDFLRDIHGWEVPSSLKKMIEQGDKASVIGQGAQSGYPICMETVHIFTRYLAIEASNLALKMKSTGGLYIGGGIPPKIWNSELREVFLHHFFLVGRLRPLLESMPVHLIRNQHTALLGAAYYGAYGHG
jgi:glucokinase